MDSEQNPSGASRARPQAQAPAPPARPVPARPVHFNTASRDISGAGRARKACRWNRCEEEPENGFIFCPTHEAAWHADKKAWEPETTERQFVRSVYNRPDDERMPYKPASLEPKRQTSREPLPPINRVLFALTSAGCDWKPAARDVDSWQSQCPTHDDHDPSLQVNRNADGSIWLKCWAGCSKEGILAALGLEWRDLWDGGQFDAGRRDGLNVKPLLPAHLRRAMEDLLKADDERRAA